MDHVTIIQRTIVYTITLTFVFMSVAACIDLIWPIIKDRAKSAKLFYILPIQSIVIGLAYYKGFLNPNPLIEQRPSSVPIPAEIRVNANEIPMEVIDPTEVSDPTILLPESRIERLDLELTSVFNDGGVSREGYINPPTGYLLDTSTKDYITKKVSVTLGKREPTVEIRADGDRVYYRIWTQHGPFYDQWRSKVSVTIVVKFKIKK